MSLKIEGGVIVYLREAVGKIRGRLFVFPSAFENKGMHKGGLQMQRGGGGEKQ